MKVGRYEAVANPNRRTIRQESRLVTAQTLITDDASDVNAFRMERLVEQVFVAATTHGISEHSLEKAVWSTVLEIGKKLLTACLTMACLQVTERETKGRTVKMRRDKDYVLSRSTTFGPIIVPLAAYRDGRSTYCPSRQELFPLHSKCRSSILLLEWETRIGGQLPFRQAEESLAFFTHGAARTEDTTIARHIGAVGANVNHTWTCRTQKDVVDLLAKRATRDLKSGRALLYVSTDAHALRRYVDDTWKAQYKMINGIRFWCIDRHSGQTIHVGGEYTWGGCRDVAARMKTLVEYVVPKGEDAPQVVLITDGMPWIRDHIYPVMPDGTRFILDYYHLAQRLAQYAADVYGAKSSEAEAWLRARATKLLGKRPYRTKKLSCRRGHRKKKGRKGRPFRTVHESDHPFGPADDLMWTLIENEPMSSALRDLMKYLGPNLDRMDYSVYRAHGMQIGSGAMESLHRTASQMRLKVAGARWTPERAIAVLNMRLVLIADRWSDFWDRPDLMQSLAGSFHGTQAGRDA